jgi:hypothetical protein
MYKSEEMRIEILALIRVHGGESAAAKDGGKLLCLLLHLFFLFLMSVTRGLEKHLFVV